MYSICTKSTSTLCLYSRLAETSSIIQESDKRNIYFEFRLAVRGEEGGV